jgi:hypothetical protein
LFLTKAETDFLLNKREFTRDQQYYLKSRLLKKIKLLFATELPLIAKNRYFLPFDLAAFSKDLAAGCKVSPNDSKYKVAQQAKELAEEGHYSNCTVRSSIADERVASVEMEPRPKEVEEYTKEGCSGRDLNPGSATRKIKDPAKYGHVKLSKRCK